MTDNWKKRILFMIIANALVILFLMTTAQAASLPISKLLTDVARETAPANGWAGWDKGTTGGAKADAKHIYLVSNKAEFIAALKKDAAKPKIIQIKGLIDLSEGKPYTSFADQKARSQIKIPSNTTVIGVTNDAGFINGSLILNNVNNVIIRNIAIEAPVDVEPHFEKGDGWNAEWDAMNIVTSTHVWIDHVSFSDGAFTHDKYTQKDGWDYVQHDGLLDIKRGSDFITISYSVFADHDKSLLFGHSDNNAEQDEGKLNITMNNNLFSNSVQRSPRIRFGKVHSFNNVFEGSTNSKKTAYPHKYTFGLGYKGSVLSENNLFLIDGLKDNCRLVTKIKGEDILDIGSQFNGKPLNWSRCDFNNNIGWKPPYSYTLLPVEQLQNHLKVHAGSGKLIL